MSAAAAAGAGAGAADAALPSLPHSLTHIAASAFSLVTSAIQSSREEPSVLQVFAHPQQGHAWRSRARVAIKNNVLPEDDNFHCCHYSSAKQQYVVSEDLDAVNAPRIVSILHALLHALNTSLVSSNFARRIESCRVLVARETDEAILNVFLAHDDDNDNDNDNDNDTTTAIISNDAQVLTKATNSAYVHVRTRNNVVLASTGPDAVTETYHLRDGRSLQYIQPENFFSNPSRHGCESTLDWLCSCCSQFATTSTNLLELYCGCGTHTVALAPFFSNIVAVELHPRLVDAARRNVLANAKANGSVAHVDVVAAPSARFCRSVVRTRGKCLRKHLVDVDGGASASEFHVLLVDPPRCGLDADTLKMASGFEHVLYISCCKENLARDLAVLSQTHVLCRPVAVIDHFPNTEWVETAVMLQKQISL